MPKKSNTSKRRPSTPVKKPGQTIINPAASTVPTTTATTFGPVAGMEPVRPKLTPKSRQLAEGPGVRIVGGRKGI